MDLTLTKAISGQQHTAVYVFNGSSVEIKHLSAPGRYDIEMQSVFDKRTTKSDNFKPKLKHLAGSNVPIGDMETTITKEEKKNTYHKVIWSRSSKFGCVASNQDRSTPNVQMMRMLATTDASGNVLRSTNFTGRADTKHRLKQQISFILNQEFAIHGNLSEIPGLKNAANEFNHYTLSYAVNSLTKSGKLQMLTGLDERKSLKQEHALLTSNNPLSLQVGNKTINITLKPIHIHHNVSKAG